MGEQKTYNTGYSLIVTDSTTNPALIGLSMGERTGSRVFQWVWSYVLELGIIANYSPCQLGGRRRGIVLRSPWCGSLLVYARMKEHSKVTLAAGILVLSI
ncbi:hypothetical protein LY78DRAFT_711944 [Colletotrichum sublineola]|nr:hypothetical protein LY78DRAFT_711944 [Colletotrichum sublineola]